MPEDKWRPARNKDAARRARDAAEKDRLPDEIQRDSKPLGDDARAAADDMASRRKVQDMLGRMMPRVQEKMAGEFRIMTPFTGGFGAMLDGFLTKDQIAAGTKTSVQENGVTIKPDPDQKADKHGVPVIIEMSIQVVLEIAVKNGAGRKPSNLPDGHEAEWQAAKQKYETGQGEGQTR